MQKRNLILGIDPGVKTGFSSWNPNKKTIEFARTLKIHQAMRSIEALAGENNLFVRVEDARLRKYFGRNSNAKMQGAGSIKRDCKIWEDYLTDLKKQGLVADFEMIHPIKGATKFDANQFKNITGFQGATSEHSRDAAMMVYQLNNWI